MLRKILPPLLVVAASHAAWAQFDTVDTAWERPIGDSTYAGLYAGLHPVEVEAAPDGGALVVGLARDLPLNGYSLHAEVALIRVDENGGVMWTDSIPSPPEPNSSITHGRYEDAAFDSDGNAFVVVARHNDSILRRYDGDGSLAWEIDLPGGGQAGTSGPTSYDAAFIGVQPTGDVVVGGLDRIFPRVDVRTFGPDGTLRWEWRDVGGFIPRLDPRGMEIAPDGSVYLYGANNSFASHGQRVVALDPGGNFRWMRDLLIDGSVRAMDLDSQGHVVTVGPHSLGFNISKLRPDGTIEFTSIHSDPGNLVSATSIAVDDFNRITVGGARQPLSPGTRDATLFLFDPGGAFLSHVIPSVQGAGQDGSFEELHVTTRNDIVALGHSWTGVDEIILARFGHDGTERWAKRRRGGPPLHSLSTSVGLGLAVDPRGNLFTLAQTQTGGSFPNVALGVDLAKHVQNGPSSQSFCGPAQANSTGSPASIRALGPRVVNVDNLTLRADGLPPGSVTLFLASQFQGNVPNAGGGQGTLCLSGEIGRFLGGAGQIQFAAPDGSASLQLNLGLLPQPTGIVAGMAGETWSFQGWFRDANPGLTNNFTDGVQTMLQ